MATSPQNQANRHNAQKSTGLRSPEGKAAVASNARKHGLSGSFSVLAHEDRDEFNALLAHYRSKFNPTSAHENFLLDEMVQARWTLARARRIEAHLLNQLAGLPTVENEPDARIAAELAARSPNPFATVQRYTSTADRAYHRAHHDLTQARLHAERIKANHAEVLFEQRLREHFAPFGRRPFHPGPPNQPYSPKPPASPDPSGTPGDSSRNPDIAR